MKARKDFNQKEMRYCHSELFSNEKAIRDARRRSKAGVGSSVGSAGHIGDKLGIRGPVHLLLGQNK